jgi:magnesium transporter
MDWHDITDPNDSGLDSIAAQYGLHSLHVEDCRSPSQRAKVEAGDGYLFLVLKLIEIQPKSRLFVGDLNVFLGLYFLVTVHAAPVAVVDQLRSRVDHLRPDEVLHRVMEGIVDSYLPIVESLEERIDALQDRVVGRPEPTVLEQIGATRTALLQVGRILSGTRRVVFHIRHVSSPLISQELLPFLRDVHDDLAIHLETIAGGRDRLTGVLDIYLSSVANRTTEATRTLTLLGTAGLPAVIVTGFLGMNIAYPAWTKWPCILYALLLVTIVITLLLLWYLKRHDYLPGGSIARSRSRAEDATAWTAERGQVANKPVAIPH